MNEIPDSVIHWLLGLTVPMGGALFLFLLKRTFADFESKISTLFEKLEGSIAQAQVHDTKLARLDERVKNLEAKKRR